MTSYVDKVKAELLYNQGNTSARIGSFKDALFFFDQAILLDSSNPMYYNNRATTLKRLGKLQEALEQYEDIVQKFSNYGKVFLSMGSLSIEMGNFQGAVSSYQRFLVAYRRGQFAFNPIVGGMNQSLVGEDLLETALLTSINYLSKEQKELAVQAFQDAQQYNT